MVALYSSIVLALLFFYDISFSNAHKGGFSVELIHRESPKSPFYNSTETQFQRVANAIHRSITRANHFHQPSVSLKTAKATVISSSGEYLMSYSIGTPPFPLFGSIDTASDIIWMQCQPCRTCYNQSRPIFKPKLSRTYETLTCASTPCKKVKGSYCSEIQRDICKYNITYEDESRSKGDLSVDTLTLDSTNGSPIKFPKTVIGCGYENTGEFVAESSGVVGLGSGSGSLISQLDSQIGRKFSYCLTQKLVRRKSSSKLNFGDAAVVSGPGTVSTPIDTTYDDPFFYLTLEAFSVGEKRIEFGDSDEEGNIVIDSGTTLTFLPDDVYIKLKTAVLDASDLERVDDPHNSLDLCFEFSEYDYGTDLPVLPVITAHFKNADVKLKDINSFLKVSHGVVCLAFRSSSSTIFGSLAQQDLLIGYDLQKMTLSFKPTDCTKH